MNCSGNPPGGRASQIAYADSTRLSWLPHRGTNHENAGESAVRIVAGVDAANATNATNPANAAHAIGESHRIAYRRRGADRAARIALRRRARRLSDTRQRATHAGRAIPRHEGLH